MKVFLLNPPADHAARMPVSTAYAETTFVPPLGLLYISSALRDAGHRVMFVDGMAPGVGANDIAEAVRGFAPDLVGMPAYTFVFYDLVATARLVKAVSPGVKIVLGGPHIDIYPEETLTHDEFDYLIAGEGEEAIVELCEAIAGDRTFDGISGLWLRDDKGRPVFGGPRRRIEDLDRLAFPDTENLLRSYYHCAFNPAGYEIGMVTSRGCPFKCRYCNVLERKYTSRSAENVVAEFEHLANAGFQYAHLYDDTFNLKLDRAKDICRGLAERRLAERRLPIGFSARLRGDMADDEFFELLAAAGCDRVNIGVESASESILRSMDKKIDLQKVRQAVRAAREHGIRTVTFFMLGFPDETESQMRDTIDLALELGSDYAQFLPVMPFPGTPLYRDALAAGGIKSDYYREQTLDPQPDFHLQLWETAVPLDRLVRLVQQAYRRFYFTPRFLWREVRSLRNYAELRDKTRLGLKLLSYQLGKIWH